MLNTGTIIKNNAAAFFLSICLMFAVSCSDNNTTNSNADQNVSNQSANNQNSNSPKDNAEELATIIKLNEMPDEAEWREEEKANPKGKKLTAVLKYNDENAQKVVASAESIQPGAPIEIGAEDWFPLELTAQTQLSGNESLKGVSYAANEFLNPPFTNGRLIKIEETNYFMLELTTY
jgi:hypothetical protein